MSDVAGMTPVLEAEHLTRHFHDGERELHILKDINISVQPGEVVAILGRSGTGKSTLLNCLGLLDRPSTGALHICGQDATGLSESQRTRLRGRTIGFIFQQYHLLDELTASENVALGMAVAQGGGLGSIASQRATEMLDLVGLLDRATHRSAHLSGGEQQRVAIARALINNPAILLCDEPTGSLDPHTGEQVMEIFWNAVRERKTAMVLVTHDEVVAERADRIFRLTEGELHSETSLLPQQ